MGGGRVVMWTGAAIYGSAERFHPRPNSLYSEAEGRIDCREVYYTMLVMATANVYTPSDVSNGVWRYPKPRCREPAVDWLSGDIDRYPSETFVRLLCQFKCRCSVQRKGRAHEWSVRSWVAEL